MIQTWLVTADHVHPDYRFIATTVLVREVDDGFYAMHRLGCSKTYATAYDAAVAMFLDNACTNVKAERVA